MFESLNFQTIDSIIPMGNEFKENFKVHYDVYKSMKNNSLKKVLQENTLNLITQNNNRSENDKVKNQKFVTECTNDIQGQLSNVDSINLEIEDLPIIIESQASNTEIEFTNVNLLSNQKSSIPLDNIAMFNVATYDNVSKLFDLIDTKYSQSKLNIFD